MYQQQQPVYGYNGQQGQQQGQQQQHPSQAKQQSFYNQPYSPVSDNRNLPNFNSYMSSQQSPTTTSKTISESSSPHIKKDLLSQQYSYNDMKQQHSPQTNYRPAAIRNTNPPQDSNNNFTSQDIVAGLTQPTVNYNPNTNNSNIGRIVHNSPGANNTSNNNNNTDLPTLPPLNTSSPQLKGTTNRPHERWMSEEEKMTRATNSMIPPQQQSDPSVLIQYQNAAANDRRLMSPYQQPRQPIQQLVQPQQDMFNNTNTTGGGEIGPYGCGVMGCFASFSASNGLFYHMKNTHPNVEEIYKPYRCAMPNCTKRYKNINGLQYHLRDAKGSSGHGNLTGEQSSAKAYQCQIIGCKKAYRTPNGLTYHQQHGHNISPQQQIQQQQQQMMDVMHQQHPQLMQQPHLMQSIQQQHVMTQQAQVLNQHVQQPQQNQQLPQFRSQRDKWILNNNI